MVLQQQRAWVCSAGRASVRQPAATRPHNRRAACRGGAPVRSTKDGCSAEQQPPEPPQRASPLLRAAAGILAAGCVATGHQAVAATAAAEATAADPSAIVVPLLGGAAATTTALAVATNVRARQAQEKQRERLAKLRVEVQALQNLQREELALLALQMKSKSSEFQDAWGSLQGGASGESQHQAHQQGRLAHAQQQAAGWGSRAEVEARDRQRVQLAAGELEEEAVSMQKAYRQLQDKAAELAVRLEEARREVADANAQLAVSQSRVQLVEKAWAGALQAAEDAKALQQDNSWLQGELRQAEASAAALAAEAEEAQAVAAAARAELATLQDRTGMLEEAWKKAAEEASQLRSEKRSLQDELAQAQQEARALAAQLEDTRALAARLEEAQRETAAANSQLEALRSRTAMLEKSYAASMMEAQDAAQLRKQQRKLEAALSRAQEEASALSAELNAAQKDAAAAKALLSMSHGRNALVEKAWKTAQEDAMSLRGQQRRMQAALSAAQKEARALAAELERARAVGQLEAAYGSSAEHSELGTLRSRTSMLEKAYASATEEAKAEQARRVEAERQLEWSKREVQHLTWELEGAQASIATSAAGVETIVAQLPEVVGRWQDGTPRELAHLRNF